MAIRNDCQPEVVRCVDGGEEVVDGAGMFQLREREGLERDGLRSPQAATFAFKLLKFFVLCSIFTLNREIMRFLLLTAAALALSLSTYSQPKKAAKIIVTPSDTIRLFDKLMTLLYKEGYTVKTEDKARGFIITEDKTLKQYLNPRIRIRLAVDSTVTITGEVNSNVDLTNGMNPPGFEPVVNTGMKGSVYRVAWEEMDRVAKLIGTATYSK